MADTKEYDDGARFRIKVLYVALVLLSLLALWQNLRLGFIDSSLSSAGTGKANQWDVDSLKERMSTIENKLTYEVPQKWEFTNLESRVDNLATTQNYWQQNCLCK